MRRRSPKVTEGVVKEKAKICDIPALAPHSLRRTCARLRHARVVNWSKSSSFCALCAKGDAIAFHGECAD